jgi:hypothetical protein
VADQSKTSPTAPKPPSSLCEDEVKRRLELCDCEIHANVVNELYTFGQGMAKEVLDRIRALESKAISFAAYGTGLLAFLASNGFALRVPRGFSSQLIEIYGAVGAALCAAFSIKVLMLRDFSWISQDDWLKVENFDSLFELKRFRVYTLWGTISEHEKNRTCKANDLKRAERFLIAACLYLLCMVLIAASVRLDSGTWHVAWHGILGGAGISRGQWAHRVALARAGALLFALPLVWAYFGLPRRTRSS